MPTKTPHPTDEGAPKGVPRGNTQAKQGDDAAPRMPHERDESSDSQQNQDGSAADVGRQAMEDVERGIVDTTRGATTDKVYNEKVKR